MAGKPKMDIDGRAQIAMFIDLMLQLGCSWPNIRVELFRMMQGKDAQYDEVPHQRTLEKILLQHYECKNMPEYHEKRKGSVQTSLKRKAVTMALGGHATMLIFCLKNLCGWSDNVQVIPDKDDAKNQIKLAYANESSADRAANQ